jgi:hypothetical protein
LVGIEDNTVKAEPPSQLRQVFVRQREQGRAVWFTTLNRDISAVTEAVAVSVLILAIVVLLMLAADH